MISIVLEGEKLDKIKKHFKKHWDEYVKGAAAIGAGIGAYSLAKDLPFRQKIYSDQKWDTEKAQKAHNKLVQNKNTPDSLIAKSSRNLLFKQQNEKIAKNERNEKLYGALGSGTAAALIAKSLFKKKQKEDEK